MRPLLIAIVALVVVLAALAVWQMKSQRSSDFFGVKQDFDTTGGQPMRPRLTE